MVRYMTLILVLTVAGAASAQPPRCWTNAQGVTECGTRPPPGVDARTVNAPRPATNEVVEEAEQFAETDPDAEEAQRLALQRSACELARETLAAYERSEFLYERDPTGNRRMLDEEETERVKAETRAEVETRCAGLDG